MAVVLTFPDTVTDNNIEKLLWCVLNGTKSCCASRTFSCACLSVATCFDEAQICFALLVHCGTCLLSVQAANLVSKTYFGFMHGIKPAHACLAVCQFCVFQDSTNRPYALKLS